MVELCGVRKSYDGREVVKRLSLRAASGQTTALIGPSGCGKSTLLRIIIGLILPDEGSVEVSGTTLTPENALTLRRKMGYVIQDGGLFPHLTARGNACVMARYLRWSQDEMATRLAELCDLAHFPVDALDRYPSQLSGGQKQRVSLMRALMLRPEVLLLDEPLGALDPMIRADLQTDLRDIFRRLGTTVVLVTHDIAEAGFLGDVIVVLREGAIVQKGTLNELVHSPADPFIQKFIHAQRSPLDALHGNAA
jgi:osmoprotectant transport system ATP-binding protein